MKRQLMHFWIISHDKSQMSWILLVKLKLKSALTDLQQIITCSLQSGKFPELEKIADLKPLGKKESCLFIEKTFLKFL